MAEIDRDGLNLLEADLTKVLKGLEFTKKNGPDDISHGFTHHVRVVNKAIKGFINSEGEYRTEFINDVLLVCALHDCVDKKYPEIVEKNTKMIKEKFGEDVYLVISNMSWSMRKDLNDDYLDSVKRFAEWADWWDAIDLDRCIKYTKEKHGTVKDVYRCYNERLILIWDTLGEPFKSMALNDHNRLKREFFEFDKNPKNKF